MRRRAKVLCAFGSIEILCAIIALFIFDHIPSPWGAGTLPGGLGRTEIEIDELMNWQAHVLISTFGVGLVGVIFLLCGGIMYLAAALKSVL
jgi:hypothetical protein